MAMRHYAFPGGQMTESERLRAQAERCLRLAGSAIESDIGRRMHELAAEYLALARAMEKAEASGQQQQRREQPPPPSPEQGQQPALQQQQVQPKKDSDA